MATARSNIPHGAILAQLRQRQMDEYAAAEEKKKQKAAFTNQMVQLAGMAAGGALAGPLGMGLMAGVGMGGTAGGLLGNAVTGTPVTMNQGINAAMQVGGLMNDSARVDAYNDRTMLDEGYIRLDESLMNEPMADDKMFGGNMYTPGGSSRGAYTVTTKGFDKNGNAISVKSQSSTMPEMFGTAPTGANQYTGDDQNIMTGSYNEFGTVQHDPVRKEAWARIEAEEELRKRQAAFNHPLNQGYKSMATGVWGNDTNNPLGL